MKWIKKHKTFTAVASIVLVLCIIIGVSYASIAGSTASIGRGIGGIMSAVEKPVAILASGLRNTFAGIFNYGNVLEENNQLRQEIAELQTENKDIRLTRDELEQLERLEGVFDFDAYTGSDSAEAARVISIDHSKPYVVFTIDKGKADGIEKGDIVVDGDGLIGRVRHAGGDHATVSSVLNDSTNIAFKILRDTSVMGVVSGDGRSALQGYILDEDDRVVEGDVLITSGMGVYPEGIPIGKIKKIEYDQDRQQRMVTVEPTVDFNSLQKVAIVK